MLIGVAQRLSGIENIPTDKYEVVCVGITKKGRWLYYPGDVSNIASGEWEKDPDTNENYKLWYLGEDTIQTVVAILYCPF